MSKFTGIPCVHCGRPFDQRDDVVVCPECGAPHHRACYSELGCCALESKHADGFEWTPPASAQGPGAAVQSCPGCGAPHTAGANFCPSCGRRLGGPSPTPAEPANGWQATGAPPPGAPPPSAPYNQYARGAGAYRAAADSAPQWEVNGVSARELSAYVGNGTFYFLRQFQLLLQSRFNMSWNWAGFLFKYLYFFYRKLYLYGVLMLGFFIVTGIPAMLYSAELFKAEYVPQYFGMTVPYNAELMTQLGAILPMMTLLRFLASICCGLFANKLFLKRSLSDIRATREQFPESVQGGNEYYNTLHVVGRPNRLIVFALLGVYFVAYLYFCSYLATSIGLL